jgi:hypothetical protein
LSKRLITVLVGVFAIGALVAGCGGGSDSTGSESTGSESGTALTKAEFISQGDAICEKGTEEIEAGAEEFAEENEIDTQNPKTAQQEELVSEVIVPNLSKQAEEIDALGAPSGEEAEVEAIVEALETATGEIEDEPGTLVEANAASFDKANKLAKEFGFKVCGEE